MGLDTRIGCAGWSIDRQSAPRFPGDGSHLQRYAAVLTAAEINSSFYKPHQATTYARWAASVPADFRFSVKLPRSISHDQKLVDIDELLARFAAEAGTLGDKLGCVLVQLPPSLTLQPAVADDFFARLHDSFDCMLACEARHGSWFSDEATELLRRHRITRVIADPPAGQPGIYVPTTDLVYARLHGSPRIYYSSYDEAYLDQVAAYLKDRSGWCIFDNTASGAALPNALELLDKVRTQSQSKTT
ncbi:uncharacterized protein YecE (DUF72 family) [Duganella sp. 1411]|uniref:DUF72 domain-containing protein n=1 Tax=Duganella sp. 1411 TaxID=2806572 RepID=UPI001AE40610|nr:DUF72 domain-containing protein [Duganella sp. 1411]MBP1204838.1 uncharacterized protein YecE (DUF72 family) [Duganella sp. 1411]